MGAGQSGGGVLVAREMKQYRMMAMLARDDVARMVIEVNDAGLNLGGREVNVEVVGYSDDQLLWQRQIRFRCTVKDLQSGEEFTKEINLRQFISVYHNVMVTKKLLSASGSSRREDGLMQLSPSTTGNSGRASQVGENAEDDDDRLCCVCLDRARQISLPCAHSFCPSCIHEWQLRSNSCPLCREESTVDDQWLLEDGPDLTEMEKELRTTLVNLLRST